MSANIIEIQNVCKGYDRTEVLHDVSIQVREGSIHGLIGENGCGKTTLIKCVAGIFKPDKGEVLLKGRNVYDHPEVRARMGYVADRNPFYPDMKISGMIRFFEDMYPTFSKERFDRYNEIFFLNPAQRLFALSKGQKMRLALMLNLSIRPEVLILDEPASGLDASAKRELMDLLIEQVEESGMTVFISSHDLNDLEKLCDTMTMMRMGRVWFAEELDRLKQKIRKFQVVFSGGLPGRLHMMNEILELSNVGSIYTIVVKENGEELAAFLRENGASLVEEIPLSLEDVFVYVSRDTLFGRGGGNGESV